MLDCLAIKWIRENPELATKDKLQIIKNLGTEILLATEREPVENDESSVEDWDKYYDSCEEDSEDSEMSNFEDRDSESEEDSKYCFEARRIFRLFEVVTKEIIGITKLDIRRIVEFVCLRGFEDLMEMLCRQEEKDTGYKPKMNKTYFWKGDFTGYDTPIDLLQYTLKEACPSEIVVCIAKKIYGAAHIFCNGQQYLDDTQLANIKGFKIQASVTRENLKAAIELNYKSVVLVMLGGGIFHCIRMMKDEKFHEEKIFRNAIKIVNKTVAEVIGSWVKDKRQCCENEVYTLLTKGIGIDIDEMEFPDLVEELNDRGINFSGKVKKKVLVEKLRDEVGENQLNVRIKKNVVGALIASLCFGDNFCLVDFQKNKFKPLSPEDENERWCKISDLNKYLDSRRYLKEDTFETVKLLNTSSHLSDSWLLLEVLKNVVNDKAKLAKLQAVCRAICQESMHEFLTGVKIPKELIDVLEFFVGEDFNNIKKWQ